MSGARLSTSLSTLGAENEDDPVVLTGHTVDPQVVAKVQALASQTQHGTAHVNRWQRVLVAFGEHDGTGVTGGAMTAAQAQQMADTHSSPVWDQVVTELAALEAAPRQRQPATAATAATATSATATASASTASSTVDAGSEHHQRGRRHRGRRRQPSR